VKTEKKIQIQLINEEYVFYCSEKEFIRNEIGCTIMKEDHSYNIPWTSVLFYRIDD
jgi:hypothetical protein